MVTEEFLLEEVSGKEKQQLNLHVAMIRTPKINASPTFHNRSKVSPTYWQNFQIIRFPNVYVQESIRYRPKLLKIFIFLTYRKLNPSETVKSRMVGPSTAL